MLRTRACTSTRWEARLSGTRFSVCAVLFLSACTPLPAPALDGGEDASLLALDAAPERPTPSIDGAAMDASLDDPKADAGALSDPDAPAANAQVDAEDAPTDAEHADATPQDDDPERPCRPWTVETIGSELGALENLLPDGEDGLLLADTTGGRLLRFSLADHSITTLRGDLPGIGGLAMREGWIYAALGNNILSGVTGAQDGQIVRFEGPRGTLEVWAERLIMPNGLALLPDDSAIVTRDIDPFGAIPSGITRVPSTPPREPQLSWAPLEGCNGAAVDPTGTWLYVSRTFTERAEIWRIAVDDPERRELVADLGSGLLLLLDDLTVTRRYVFVGANLAGAIYRVDVASGESCEIASGLTLPSAVKFARRAARARERLYVTSLAGDLYELSQE